VVGGEVGDGGLDVVADEMELPPPAGVDAPTAAQGLGEDLAVRGGVVAVEDRVRR